MKKEILKNCKPFVKWAGGKSQLIKDIESTLPLDFLNKKEITYIEPFVGGGAVLFWMLRNFQNITHAVINDINPNLTNAYSVIKEHPQLLIDFLSSIENLYIELKDEIERKEFFLSQRTEYNFHTTDAIERAGLFIFLNRTCFNGLYRVNKKGLFNVPFGRYVNPKICDKETILADSELLQRVDILTGDFSKTIECATKNTLFYFDPPYKPLSSTSNFTTYTQEDFNDFDQLRLGDFCKEIDKMGCRFLLSNSDVKSVNIDDDFFDDLYKKFSIRRISACRMINSKATGRGKVSELLISNVNPNSFIYEGAI